MPLADSCAGVNTGFGGSSDARTDDQFGLERALMQTLQSAVLIDSDKSISGPFQGDLLPHSMPPPWVKATMATRINQCLRGHSAISREVIESILQLARHRIVPVVPLRGSVSASGDLMSLSYLAGTLEGSPDVYVTVGAGISRRVLPAQRALAEVDMMPRVLGPREGLGLVNGTAASAATASLAMFDAAQLTILSTCLACLVSEGMAARAEWLHPFVCEVRPHPGQQEASRIMRAFLQGSELVSRLGGSSDSNRVMPARPTGGLAQDRYPLRTAPQWLGPQFEDLISAHSQISIELNSTSDNPVTDTRNGAMYHGGNFQAASVTSAVEKIRSSLQMVGKMLFSQCTEMLNHQMSGGLPSNLAADDPSVSFCLKGLDINMAAYQSELSFLANPVSNHVQSAEMHNQAINSLAFLSTRYTVQAVEVVALMVASVLYAACQAVDLRVMHATFLEQISCVVTGPSAGILPNRFEPNLVEPWMEKAIGALRKAWWDTAALDACNRCEAAASAFVHVMSEPSSGPSKMSADDDCLEFSLRELRQLREQLQADMLTAFESHRAAFFQKPDSERYLGVGSKCLYMYVRRELGVGVHHGLVDHPTVQTAETRLYVDPGEKKTIGSQVSIIYEAVRDGRLFDKTMAITRELALLDEKSWKN